MTIRYISTRSAAASLGFEEVVLTGLAPDGGLYVPDSLPFYTPLQLAAMAELPYPQLACKLLAPFTIGVLSPHELAQLVHDSYNEFAHPAVAPVMQIGHNHFVLELFHGPTLAFKDFALQFLGRLLDHILRKRDTHAMVLGATSGDTGSAAIAGCSGCERLKVVILHPHERTSEVQRRQMTTILSDNVHNLAIRGNFDDCQDMVKTLFTDAEFRARHKLVAVNSINWVRILAQTVYYFYAAFRLGAPAKEVSFVVPTGNFGDIFAGYLAKRMGLPVNRLVIATNQNDILARTLSTGVYKANGVTPSLSPSMDIQISSNFERLLYVLCNRDSKRLALLMHEFRAKGVMALPSMALSRLRGEFDAHAVNDAQTVAMIAELYKRAGYMADPHTAVGIASAQALFGHAPNHPVVTLATAHPAKFPDAIKQAIGISPPLPIHMADLMQKTERFQVLDNDIESVKQCIIQADGLA